MVELSMLPRCFLMECGGDVFFFEDSAMVQKQKRAKYMPGA